MRGQLRTAFPQYESHWAVSTGKKGYSGVVVLVKVCCGYVVDIVT